jgi:hypothetical protein
MYVMWTLHFLYEGDHESEVGGPWLKGIYLEQFLFYSLHLVIRSFIIAVRYGSCSDLRFSLLRDQNQSAEFIGKDLLANGWLNFDPSKGLLTEINSSLYRNQVEEHEFHLSVFEKLDPEISERLSNKDYYEKNIWVKKDREAELKHYVLKASAK